MTRMMPRTTVQRGSRERFLRVSLYFRVLLFLGSEFECGFVEIFADDDTENNEDNCLERGSARERLI